MAMINRMINRTSRIIRTVELSSAFFLKYFATGNIKMRPIIINAKYGTMEKLLLRKSANVPVGWKKEFRMVPRSERLFTLKRSHPRLAMMKVMSQPMTFGAFSRYL